MQIDKDTLQELEFNKILEEIAPFCYSDKAKEEVFSISPIAIKPLQYSLKQTSEYLSSFSNENTIPFGQYDDILPELKIVEIEGITLEAKSFIKIRHLSFLVNTLIKHFTKFKEYFPVLLEHISPIEYTKEIVTTIDSIFNRFGEVKNEASPTLHKIRIELNRVQKEIQENFDKSLSHYSKSNVLHEIRESVIDNHRVLAVKTELKKQVKGRVLGFSKTGSICFIVPESVTRYNVSLLELQAQEKKEIDKILQLLTQKILEYVPLLHQYQIYIFELDIIQAKAKYAQKLNAILPTVKEEPYLDIKEAYHPILLLNNSLQHKKTIPQNIELIDSNRIICISGPNAGGKSITLKTVGLLQLMLQSGILVPVHPKSTFGYFNKILTDIGDNQSIENHLSTYSSRLKRMNQIIKKADNKTLLLIDEFGTGSDPELGGALAESFLEFFYQKGCFGIITTHYTNIKLKVEELPEAINAAMLFNERDLSPLYKLEVGQVGSSFTFEVAQKNNIPAEIIQSAKDKIEQDTLDLDKTIVKLQRERHNIEQLKSNLNRQINHSSEKKQELSEVINTYNQRLLNFQKLYDQESRLNQLGSKFEKFIEAYSSGKARKDITKDFIKILEQEKYKNTEVSEKEKVQVHKQRKKVKEEIKKENIEQQALEQKQKDLEQIPKRLELWKQQGRKVRIKGSSSAASIDKIEGTQAFLNYGKFTTKVSIYDLELV